MFKSELAWTLADYFEHGEEPPSRIIAAPEACEGQLMSQVEVDQFIKDGVATLLVMNDSGSSRFPELQQMFFADLEFLVSIGRISVDDYNDLIDPSNYSF